MLFRSHAKRLITGGVSLAVTVGVLTSGGSAAAEPSSDPAAETFTLKADRAVIAQARSRAGEARDRGQEPAELRELRATLARNAAQDGQTLLAQDTEAFALSDKVSVAISKSAHIESVTVAADPSKVVAEVTSQDAAGGTEAPSQGQGMGWTYKNDGTFLIKITGAGEMESRYYKYRYEGTDAPDLMSMRRKGLGRAYEIDGLNYSVTGLYISSHVVDADRPKVTGRWASKPENDFTGDCNDTGFGLDIKGLGFSFIDCDKNDINYDVDNPGYYRNYMTQGASFSQGDRSVAFHNVVKIKDGAGLGYTHYQRLEMARWVYPADKCSSWDSNNTC